MLLLAGTDAGNNFNTGRYHTVLLEEQGGPSWGKLHQQLGDIDRLGIGLVTLLECLWNGAKEEDSPLPKGVSPWFGSQKEPVR